MSAGEIDMFQPDIKRYEGLISVEFAPGGLVYDIAQRAVETSVELLPHEVIGIIVSKRGPKFTRQDIIESGKKEVMAAVAERAEEVLALATIFDMRRAETFPDAHMSRILPDHEDTLWYAEEGTPNAAVVRPLIADQGMDIKYSESREGQILFLPSSGKPIKRQVEKVKEGKKVTIDNPDFKQGHELAGEHLPQGDSFTMFDLRIAIARMRGFELTANSDSGDLLLPRDTLKVAKLEKPGERTLVAVQPATEGRGSMDSIAAVVSASRAIKGRDPRQLVPVTNGQFRPKNRVQAAVFAAESKLALQAAVALGDEPGHEVTYNGKPLTTKERQSFAYAVEIGKLGIRFIEGV